MKIWECQLEIRNGETERTVSKVVRAENHNQAYKIIKKFSKDYYGGKATEEFDDSWSFDGGCIIVSYAVLRETTEEKRKQEQFEIALIL